MILYNGVSLNNGNMTLIPKNTVPPKPIVPGSGFVFGYNGPDTVKMFDTWYGTDKVYTNSYISGMSPTAPPSYLPDDGTITFPNNGVVFLNLSDNDWSATSAHPTSEAANNKVYLLNNLGDGSAVPPVLIYRVYQFDFWHQFEFRQEWPIIDPPAILPDESANIKRGEALSKFNLNPMRYQEYPGWPVSTSYPDRWTRTWFFDREAIEPFITAMKAACPNVNGCGSLRYNCSIDYDHCCTAYPDWYN